MGLGGGKRNGHVATRPGGPANFEIQPAQASRASQCLLGFVRETFASDGGLHVTDQELLSLLT